MIPVFIQQLKKRNRQLWQDLQPKYEAIARCRLAMCDANEEEKEKRKNNYDKIAREYDHNLITMHILRRLYDQRGN